MVEPSREQRVRSMWWAAIRELSEPEAKAALLQMLADLAEHWSKEHAEDGLPEDLGIPPDEYITTLIERVRTHPPAEAGR